MSEREQKPPPCLLKATTVVAHLALRAPGNPAEESVARRLAWISMD